MLLSRSASMNQIITNWLQQNQKALEVGSYSKVNFEIIIGQRSGNPVKLRVLLSSESDLSEQSAY